MKPSPSMSRPPMLMQARDLMDSLAKEMPDKNLDDGGILVGLVSAFKRGYLMHTEEVENDRELARIIRDFAPGRYVVEVIDRSEMAFLRLATVKHEGDSKIEFDDKTVEIRKETA